MMAAPKKEVPSPPLSSSSSPPPDQATSADSPNTPPPKRFSFLVDQEYQRRRDEAAAAAAAAQVYRPGYKDYLLFSYFCVNIFLIGNGMLNANAMTHLWKMSETFRLECADIASASDWCPEQAESAHTALLLYQSAAAATAMLGGVLVDTFSAAMCLLIAHFMFCGGCHLLQNNTTRGIFLACVLHGVSGELLLNSVIPISGLFPKRQNLMLIILTIFSDLSVLLYPSILALFGPKSVLASDYEEFSQSLYSRLFYFAILAALVGTYFLPVDDDGTLMPVTMAAAGQSLNKVPAGVLRGPNQVRLGGEAGARGSVSSLTPRGERRGGEMPDDQTPLLSAVEGEDDDTRISIGSVMDESVGAQGKGGFFGRLIGNVKARRRNPPSLWNLRFTKQIGTASFWVVLGVFSACTLRNSFYLLHNERLFETAGDDGTLIQAFPWLLGLSAVFNPISWYINDTWDVHSTMWLLVFLNLAVNVFVAVDVASLQWATAVTFVASRSFLCSTILTFIASCFGTNNFPLLTVVIGLLGSFANFFNAIIERFSEQQMQGDYHFANYCLVGVGLITILLLLVQSLYPVANSPPSNAGTTAEDLKAAISSVDAAPALPINTSPHQQAPPPPFPSAAQLPLGLPTVMPPQQPPAISAAAVRLKVAASSSSRGPFDEGDEWEDEEVVEQRAGGKS